MRFFIVVGIMFAVSASAPALAQRIPIKKPESFVRLATMITVSGYECPKAVLAWNTGLSPLGPKFDVFCGLDQRVFERLHYAVFPKRKLVRVCAPSVYKTCDE